MDISISCLRSMGYKRLYKIYKDSINSYPKEFAESSTLYEVKVSAFSIGSVWNDIFKDTVSKNNRKFIQWYKYFAPDVENNANKNLLRKAYKGYQTIVLDFCKTTGCNLGSLGLYLPLKAQEFAYHEVEVIPEEYKKGFEFCECLFSWALLMEFNAKDREIFTGILEKLVLLSDEEFVKFLRSDKIEFKLVE